MLSYWTKKSGYSDYFPSRKEEFESIKYLVKYELRMKSSGWNYEKIILKNNISPSQIYDIFTKCWLGCQIDQMKKKMSAWR